MLNTSSEKVSVNYSLSLGLLNTEHKPSVKKRSTGPVRPVNFKFCAGWSTGIDFEFYQSGRVKKILTGSISGTGACSPGKILKIYML